MKLSHAARVISSNLLERKGRTAAAVFVVGFAVAVGLSVVSLAFGFLRGIVAKAEESLPPSMLTVRPRTLNVAMLAMDMGAITSATVQSVRAMPGVEWAGAQVSLRMPLRASGSIMGQTAESDCILAGVDPAVVRDDVSKGYTFDYVEGTSVPIPIIVPRFFLDMFNLAYADMAGLPKIDESFALGRKLDLIIGDTVLLGSTGRTLRLPMQVVGFTSNPSLTAGLLIPSGHAAELNRWYTMGKTEGTITALHLKVQGLERVDEVTKLLRAQNLIVEDTRGKLSQVTVLARAGTATVGALGLAVAAIAAVAVFNLFSLTMSERRGEAVLLRAVGGTRLVVVGLYMGEVAVVGLIAGLSGTGGAAAILAGINYAVRHYLPRVSYIPDRIFYLSPSLVMISLVSSALFCMLAAWPAVRGTTRNIGRGVTGTD